MSEQKRLKVLPHEDVFLKALPCSPRYVKSYMHKETITQILVSTKRETIISASIDGVIKFWKRPLNDESAVIEYVKGIKAHSSEISLIKMSRDNAMIVTFSRGEQAVKIYDLVSLDMITMIKLTFDPTDLCWTDKNGMLLFENKVIYRYDAFDKAPKKKSIPFEPIVAESYGNTLVLASRTELYIFDLDSLEERTFTNETHLNIKTETFTIVFSDDGKYFVPITKDRQIRVFKTATGRLFRQYNEGLDIYSSPPKQSGIDEAEMVKRLDNENCIDEAPYDLTFDETSNFIIFSSPIGIKVLNMVTNKVSCYLGSQESLRFTKIALLQPVSRQNLELAASANPSADKKDSPILVAVARNKPRIYLFTRSSSPITDRDVINERIPTKDEATFASNKKTILPTQSIIRTTMGDIVVKLLPDIAPLAVENFSTHARNGYYDSLIFHRVIKGFMIQGGDPLGDGTGGESIWGTDFKDEINPEVKHDQPFTLSMANAGTNTNGSQFFITTIKCPWLDGKHTIFGRVVGGSDVVTKIEHVQTDDLDKPVSDVKILQIDTVI